MVHAHDDDARGVALVVDAKRRGWPTTNAFTVRQNMLGAIDRFPGKSLGECGQANDKLASSIDGAVHSEVVHRRAEVLKRLG